MWKKGMACLACVVLTVCLMGNFGQAEIIPAYGMGQIGLEAVVLCESLTVRQERSASSKAVRTLKYGDKLVVWDVFDGWAECYLSENEGPAGYVKSDYLAIDPAWYRTDGATPVYAWNDTLAPQVALLDKGETLPILKDDGVWLVVSLRGAAGWILKTWEDKAQGVLDLTWFHDLQSAVLTTEKGSYLLTDPEGLRWIEENFSIAQASFPSGCPFNAELTLYRADGAVLTLYPATDSCHCFRTKDDYYFNYGDGDAALRESGSTSSIGEAFWRLFGSALTDLYPWMIQ